MSELLDLIKFTPFTAIKGLNSIKRACADGDDAMELLVLSMPLALLSPGDVRMS